MGRVFLGVVADVLQECARFQPDQYHCVAYELLGGRGRQPFYAVADVGEQGADAEGLRTGCWIRVEMR